MKIVEQRVHRKFIDEREQRNFVVRRYRDFKERAVSLFKLHGDGLLELRIHSHVNTSEYTGNIATMWSMVSPILRRSSFTELFLAKAKTNLWKKRNELKHVIRYSDSRLRNSKDTILSAATGTQQASLYDDEGAIKSLDEFMRHDAICDASNIWWLKARSGVPSKHIHVLLSGLPNEFAVTAKCSKEDYAYALRQLRQNNR